MSRQKPGERSRTQRRREQRQLAKSGSKEPVTKPTGSTWLQPRLVALGIAVAIGTTALVCHLQPEDDPILGPFERVASFPHDPQAYTQGLLYAKGRFYESTGKRGRSTLRRVELHTGRVEKSIALPDRYFGEGLALHDDKLFQLTWHAGKALVYDANTLELLKEFEYTGEGWGLTSDGQHLIQSDGSDELQFRDPQSFEVVRRVRVTHKGEPIRFLNELEFVEGQVFANVWRSTRIARIDPQHGRVLEFIELADLYDPSAIPSNDAVLNGIAYDPESRRLFVTGKLWPKVFEIKVPGLDP